MFYYQELILHNQKRRRGEKKKKTKNGKLRKQKNAKKMNGDPPPVNYTKEKSMKEKMAVMIDAEECRWPCVFELPARRFVSKVQLYTLVPYSFSFVSLLVHLMGDLAFTN